MATKKSFTDISQSKKLAEILPHESADMCYIQDLLAGGKYGDYKPYIGDLIPAYGQGKIRCWSLSALLDVLRFPALRYDIEDGEGGWIVSCEKDDKGYLSYYRDNPVDTCYEMIIKLHEQKLL